GADAAQRRHTRVDLRNLVDQELRDGPRIRGAGALDPGPLRVGGEGEHEYAPAVRERGVDHGSQRAEPQVGARGDRVDIQRTGWVEVCLRVRFDSRPDITSLDVEQAYRPRVAQLSDS